MPAYEPLADDLDYSDYLEKDWSPTIDAYMDWLHEKFPKFKLDERSAYLGQALYSQFQKSESSVARRAAARAPEPEPEPAQKSTRRGRSRPAPEPEPEPEPVKKAPARRGRPAKAAAPEPEPAPSRPAPARRGRARGGARPAAETEAPY